jgi:hypothetical protein
MLRARERTARSGLDKVMAQQGFPRLIHQHIRIIVCSTHPARWILGALSRSLVGVRVCVQIPLQLNNLHGRRRTRPVELSKPPTRKTLVLFIHDRASYSGETRSAGDADITALYVSLENYTDNGKMGSVSVT